MAIDSNVDEQKLIEFIGGSWKDWKDARRRKEDIWDELIRHYLVQVDESQYDGWPWRCKISRPVTQSMVDSIHSSLKNAAFPLNEDFFEAIAVGEQADKFTDFEIPVRNHMKRQLFAMRYTERMEPFVKQLSVIGNTTGESRWFKDTRKVKRHFKGNITTRSKITSNYPLFETHDMFDVVYDIGATEYSSKTVRIRRELVSKAEVEKMAEREDSGITKESLKGLEASESGSSLPIEQEDSRRDFRRKIFGIDPDFGKMKERNQVELLIATGDIEIDGEIFEDYIGILANRKVLLQFERNPIWVGNTSIFANYSSYLVNEPLGRGPAEPIMGNQKLIDTLSCQRVDIITLMIGGFWAVGRDSVTDMDNLVSRPFNIVEMDNINDIKSLVPTGNPTLSFSETRELEDENEKSTGASKFAQGFVAPGQRTATEVSIIGSGTSNRFNDISIRLGEQAIEPMLNHFWWMENQFNYKRKNTIKEEEAWDGEYIIQYNGARNAAIRREKLIEFQSFSNFLSANPIFSQFMNAPAFTKEAAKLHNIDPEDKNLIRSQPLSAEFPTLGGVGGQRGAEGSEVQPPGVGEFSV